MAPPAGHAGYECVKDVGNLQILVPQTTGFVSSVTKICELNFHLYYFRIETIHSFDVCTTISLKQKIMFMSACFILQEIFH